MKSIHFELAHLNEFRYLQAESSSISVSEIFTILMRMSMEGELSQWLGCASCAPNLESDSRVTHPGIVKSHGKVTVVCPIFQQALRKQMCINKPTIVIDEK